MDAEAEHPQFRSILTNLGREICRPLDCLRDGIGRFLDEGDWTITDAERAQAHRFIQRLPEGYDTAVGDRGVTLSGGQRQRTALARAILVEPTILILDDATSSVDMETERLIEQALEEIMRGRTTFVIAHRLSTVKRADEVLVLEKGEIVERDPHGRPERRTRFFLAERELPSWLPIGEAAFLLWVLVALMLMWLVVGIILLLT